MSGVRQRYAIIEIPRSVAVLSMFIHSDSRDSAISSNLNRLRLVRYWPIGNSFFWLLSPFLDETLVGSEDLRRSICRDDTHGANCAGPLEYLRLISAVECLPEFYQPLLSHPLRPSSSVLPPPPPPNSHSL